MKKILLAGVALLALVGTAGAQPAGQCAAGQVWANPTSSAGQCRPAALGGVGGVFDQSFGNLFGTLPWRSTNGIGGWIASAGPQLGSPPGVPGGPAPGFLYFYGGVNGNFFGIGAAPSPTANQVLNFPASPPAAGQSLVVQSWNAGTSTATLQWAAGALPSPPASPTSQWFLRGDGVWSKSLNSNAAGSSVTSNPTAGAQSMLNLFPADSGASGNAAVLNLYSYSNGFNYADTINFWNVGGTGAVPATTTTGGSVPFTLGQFAWGGYDTSIPGFTGNQAIVRVTAAQAWSSSSHDAFYQFFVTPINSISTTLAATLKKGLYVGSTSNPTDPGVGVVQNGPQTFAGLATCNSTSDGSVASVTDSTTNSFGAVIAGGGSLHVQAYCNGSQWTVSGGGTAIAGGTPPNYLSGLLMQNTGGTNTNQIDVGAGSAADSGNTALINFVGQTAKDLTVLWATGSSSGCLEGPGAIADGTWWIWLISTGSVNDILCSASATSPTMTRPGGTYTLKRRIGAIVRKGGNNLLFTQLGNDFLLKVPQHDFAAQAVSSAGVSFTFTSFPNGLSLKIIGNSCIFNPSLTTSMFIFGPGLMSPDPIAGYGASTIWAGSTNGNCAQVQIYSNTTGQLRFVSTRASGDQADFTVTGWADTRGQ